MVGPFLQREEDILNALRISYREEYVPFLPQEGVQRWSVEAPLPQTWDCREVVRLTPQELVQQAVGVPRPEHLKWRFSPLLMSPNLKELTHEWMASGVLR